MFELQYLLIGILQGITEFLPISSSGHLVLFAKLTGWEDQGLFTDIAVHFGTLFAVIFYMRKDIFFLIINIFKLEFLSNKIVLKIIVATLPAIFVGFFIFDPSEISIFRIPSTKFLNSLGSNDALWSGPSKSLSKVKCFSITLAPIATAASEISIPLVWSE